MSHELLSRLFTEVPQADVWRIRRINDPATGQRIGPFLLYGRYPNGDDRNEWLLEEFDPAVVLDRWGEGLYSLELYAIDERGAHASKGRSRYFLIDEDGGIGIPVDPPKPNALRPDPTQQTASDRPENRPPWPAAPSAPEAAAPTPQPQAPKVAIDTSIQQAIQLMNYLNAQTDTRAQRAQAAEREMFRANAEQQAQFYQAMLAMNAQQQQMALSAAAAAPALTPDAVAQIVRAVVREELEANEEAPQSIEPSGANGTAAVVMQSMNQMVQTLTPLLERRFSNGHNGQTSGGG